ncbi:MAG: rhamnulokinase [Oscillospiraceae bacterium]|nr:rhamnulokinase [Oscillospiraceae bacterium]
MGCYLAIDIGAGSGRHILGELKSGVIELTEVYRFENRLIERNGSLCWDLPAIFEHIILGIKECIEHYVVPDAIAIDSWGVDFVLIDEDGEIIGDSVAYRDTRTEGMDLEVEKHISFADLYARTGIQKMLLNSIYQLTSIKTNHPEQLQAAKHLLLIPDYLNYLLTGRIMTEYTNATTTSLINLDTKDWDYELIDMLGLPRQIFVQPTAPGIVIGPLSEEISKRVGANTTVFLVATHDTASAFVSIPSFDESVFISSGTWSLLGVESEIPIVNEKSQTANFTNEGGYSYIYRVLKNYMGLWMLQSVRRDLSSHTEYSYSELADLARNGADFTATVDVNNSLFTAPKNMIDAVQTVLKRNSFKEAQTLEQTLYCIYHSLALSYSEGVDSLTEITGRKFQQINIVGGGCQDEYLNQLTADTTGLKVVTGPVEATAIGNLLVMMIANKEFADREQARRAVSLSFELKEYLPYQNT